MKIGIDISQIVYETGVSWYTSKLVENLLKIDNKNDFVLFGCSLRRRKNLMNFLTTLQGASFKGRIYSLPPTFLDLIWNKLHILPIEIFTGKLDVFHSSDWTQPPSSAFKVTTIHDLAPLIFAKFTNPVIVNVHKRRLRWVRNEADRIIVPSKSTMKDLIEAGFDESKVRVISEGPTIEKAVAKPEGEIARRKYRISGKYLLAIGINERKNTQRIIQAYEKVKTEEDLKLILIGEPQMFLPDVRGLRVLGHISQGDLNALLCGAEMLVYPSLYEGFGLPILDAFVCRVPVVTSNISSMPEVAGDAAVLVDPYSVESISEGIRLVLKNKKDLVKKGRERVKSFSWQRTALETLKVYEEAVVSKE